MRGLSIVIALAFAPQFASAQILSDTDIDAMVQMNRSNEIMFNRTYKGRHFAADGKVAHIGEELFGNGAVVRVDADGGEFICTVRNPDKVATMGVGDKVHASGVVKNTLLGTLMVDDCDVQSFTVSSRPPMQAPGPRPSRNATRASPQAAIVSATG